MAPPHSQMDWREDYKRRLCSPQDAAAMVRSGDLVHTGLLPMPRLIADAIVARRDEFGHLDISMCEPEYDPGFLDSANSDKFSVTVEIHIGTVAIEAHDEKRIGYSPVLFSTWFKPAIDQHPRHAHARCLPLHRIATRPERLLQFRRRSVEQAHLLQALQNRPSGSRRTFYSHLWQQLHPRFRDRRLSWKTRLHPCTTRS